MRRKKNAVYYVKKFCFYGVLILLAFVCVIPLY